ncbi:PLP-dependent aminotransferase family protein [Caldilinea sp.]|uniref:MocR-like pyridoxine biosynthesis transcription factor PdxR n=1 Tax=Caldilinea sp. TaxID=2293560 RepID=UPI00257DB65F|nr:PLP-dependent aminotransferase family protein [Caldilinea sp.]
MPTNRKEKVMPLEIVLKRNDPAPLYQQIAEQIKRAIASGHLPAGAQLPTVRRLAAEVGVTRLTVQNAYAELQSSGWIESTVGRGTFVSAQASVQPRWSAASGAATPAAVIGDILQMGRGTGILSFASASPDPQLFPEAEFWAALESQRQRLSEAMSYGPAQGDTGLRIELAAHLAERGLSATPDDLLVVAGVSQGVMLAAQALAQPGDSILIEQPTYVGFLHQLRTLGLQPMAVPVDEEGLRLDVVEQMARAHRIRFFYTIPSFQNPTGYCMSHSHRLQLLELAERYGFYIIEDDLYGWLAYDAEPPLPIKALDAADRVIYISGFSKTLAPGVRLGVMAPPSALRDRLIGLRIAADLGSPLLLQWTLAAFLHRGEFRRHLRRVLPVYQERRDALLAALGQAMPPGVHWTRPRGGLCCWVTLPRPVSVGEIPRLALQQGWAVAPGSIFWTNTDGERNLRLCFGGLTVGQLRRGVEVIAEIVRQQLAFAPVTPASPVEWLPMV